MEFGISLLMLLALLGHGYLWVAFFNHTHSVALSRRIIGPLNLLWVVCINWIPIGFALWLAWGEDTQNLFGRWPGSRFGREIPRTVASVYLGACWLAGAFAVIQWTWIQLLRPSSGVVRRERISRVDLRRTPEKQEASGEEKKLPDARPHPLIGLPGNQILKLEVAEREVEIPRLPETLDGFSIVHLSDLHFSGRIERGFFDEVIRQSNAWASDLVAITGDLVDRADLCDWIPETLGKLQSRLGVFFVLGNHDQWSNPDRLRRTLTGAGLVDLSLGSTEIGEGGERLLLAANEMPWGRPATDFAGAPPPSSRGGPTRIALAHTPDRLGWARHNEVDLLLVGHTHGGQIRVPLVGPLLSASRSGIRYSSGIFHASPTVMHVSRGVSAESPVRFHCPPEITKLVLRAGVETA